MIHSLKERVFEHVAEGPVSDVVQQDGCLHGFGLAVEDEVPLHQERLNGFAHQVEGTQGVLKAGVLCSWIDNVGSPQLLDAAEAVEGRVAHNVEQQTSWHTDEPKHGVVDDFSVLHGW